MPRRELLTPTERLQLLAFPEDNGELIRLLTLTKADLAFVRQHRGDHNRLGIAVLMSYLRHPGRILGKDEKPHEQVLKLVAEQLQIPAAVWEMYADRDETRRKHLMELLSLLGTKPFSTRHYRAPRSGWSQQRCRPRGE
jgi:TnpA family transposase